jgi:hypothetical protein
MRARQVHASSVRRTPRCGVASSHAKARWAWRCVSLRVVAGHRLHRRLDEQTRGPDVLLTPVGVLRQHRRLDAAEGLEIRARQPVRGHPVLVGQQGVGRVAHQRVAKPVALDVGVRPVAHRLDPLGPDQRRERQVEVRRRSSGERRHAGAG